MLFLLQDQHENDALSVEIEELRIELENNPIHSYIIVNSDFFNNRDIQKLFKNAIPVGTIEFVQKFIFSMYGIEHMNPIEIPKELMLEKFLLRDYQVCRYIDLPKNQYKFIKNVSVLKQPTFIGNTSDLFKARWLVNVNDYYQVADVLNIMAEYRVIVMDDEIQGIQFYDGICTIMPNEIEIKKIQEMVLRYSQSKTRPEAYILDIAIVKTNNKELNNRDVALIEVQPFCACGTYGCRGYFLPQLYQKGLNWYINQNHKNPLVQDKQTE